MSAKDTLRGLHMQVRKPQGKLVRAVEGEIWDVAVDVRPIPRRSDSGRRKFSPPRTSTSSTFRLDVPTGSAYLSEPAQVQYRVRELYDPADEIGIAWNDPALAIQWPIAEPLLSERDRRHGSLQNALEKLEQRSADQRNVTHGVLSRSLAP